MACVLRRWGLLAPLIVVACGDDAVGTGDTTTGGSTGTTGSDGADTTGDVGADTTDASASASGDTDTGVDPDSTGVAAECTVDDDCNDGNACTEDDCDGGVCTVSEAVESLACRPQIDVDFPPRGATLEDASPVVTVTGTVTSPAAPIATFRINGEDVPVRADGSFSHDVTATSGGNILLLETVDELDVPRRRVQSFLWSTDYRSPTTPTAGITTQGLEVYLDQDTLDDGNASLPADDMATLMSLAIGNIDIEQFVDPSTPIASNVSNTGYNVYLTNIAYVDSDTSVAAIDGGVHVTASLNNVTGTLVYDCTSSFCSITGDSTGGMSVAAIVAEADLLVSVNASHQLVVTTSGTTTSFNGLTITTGNGALDFLVALVQPFLLGGIISDIEDELSAQIDALVGPALSQAIGGLAPNAPLVFPNLANPAAPIAVNLVTDFQSTDFHDGVAPPAGSPPQGGLVTLRGGGYTVSPMAPYLNLGAPDRDGCGTGGPDLQMPRSDPFELGLTDDMLNSLLFSAWRGGLLEFDMPSSLLPAGGLVTDLDLHVSGMLAPTASDCAADGQARVHVGDVGIAGSLTLQGNAVTFEAWSSLTAGLQYTPTASGVAISLSEIETVETELTVGEDSSLGVEELLRFTLEQELVDGLIGAISAGGLGEVNLPSVDLSATLGLPAGTAVIQISTTSATRHPGGVVIGGEL